MPRPRLRSRAPRLRSGAVVLLVLLAFVATLGLLASRDMSASLAAAPTFQQGEGPSACVISGTKRAAPQQILFGEPISVTMAVEAACPSGAGLAAAVLVDPLGAAVELASDSVRPPATALGPAGRRPEWRFSAVPAGGITVTLVVTPTAAGFVTTNAGATWSITDTDGLTATLRLPNPRVLVLGGPGPAATATRAPMATATPAPVPPAPIYLPFLDRGYLGGRQSGGNEVRLDTVVVFERHTSTTGDPRGTTRALRQLAQGLIFAPDGARRRVGMISFGGVRWVCSPTDDIEAFEDCAERALADGPAVGGDLAGALRDARDMLSDSTHARSPRPASAVVALAVKDRPAGCDSALAELDGLRAEGTRLITLCPGDGCERTCLRDVASGRADYVVMQSFAWLLPTLDGVLERLLPMGAPW